MTHYKLSQLLQIKNGKDHQQLSSGPYPVYGSGGIIRYVSDYIYDEPSILLPRKGTLSNIQYCDQPFWTVDTSYYTIINTELADPYYLFTLLCSLDLSKLYTGTGVPSMTFSAYYNIELDLPDLPTQKKIAKVLSDIDTKLSLNRRINERLEQVARQLYDYWFVQFDFPDANGNPYRTSGGKMIYNDQLKREIPEGWHCGNLFEIAKFTNGIACQKYRPIDNKQKLPVIKITEMHDGISSLTEFVRSDIPQAVHIYDGDILFSWSASLEIQMWAGGEGGLNQHIFKVTGNNGFPRSFYYFSLLSYIQVFQQIANARKTTMGHITQDHLLQSRIAIPNENKIAVQFESMIKPIFDEILLNSKQNLHLTALRDRLLPLLMNGQVTIKD